MENALAIFAKAPIVGQVKTRLCPPLSPEEAKALYQCFLLDTVNRAIQLSDVHVCLAFTPVESEQLLRAFLPESLLYFPQRGDSLGEREANVFVDLLQRGFSRIVLIGSDIPTLPIAHLRDAFALLADIRNDVVLGPSEDGGYYLIGARELHSCLFENIAWSTATVLAETLTQARRHRLSVAQVPTWYDVDSKEELQRLAAELCSSAARENAQATRALLHRFGYGMR